MQTKTHEIAAELRQMHELMDTMEALDWPAIAVLVWTHGVDEPLPETVAGMLRGLQRIDAATAAVRLRWAQQSGPAAAFGPMPESLEEINRLSFDSLCDRFRLLLMTRPVQLIMQNVVLRELRPFMQPGTETLVQMRIASCLQEAHALASSIAGDKPAS